MPQQSVIDAIRTAVEADPDNLALRRHLADLLFEAENYAQAEQEYRQVLANSPDDIGVKLALAKSFLKQEKWMVALVVLEELLKSPSAPAEVQEMIDYIYKQTGQKQPSRVTVPETHDSESTDRPKNDVSDDDEDLIKVPIDEWMGSSNAEVERSKVSFKDVGGMNDLKEEIRIKIIHPMNNPDIYKAYGKSVGGGILMYGPPGCGKTHLARATAGEVNAQFMAVGIHDVLNMYLGQSEHNLHQLFEVARHHKPCVLFIDEVDALGASRTDMRRSAGRHLINQLLAELDGINASNDGVLILAATNAPWHLDPALRRPGRFDRIIFVPPPDAEARAEILKIMVSDKPVDDIDFQQVAKRTGGFSGADLKAVVDIAVEGKLTEALKKGVPDPINTRDLMEAIRKVNSSTKDWFASARNYALYANESGLYDDIVKYLDDNSDLFSRMAFWRQK